MLGVLSDLATRLRVKVSDILTRIGFREDSFLVLLAVLLGVITAAAAVAFHELIGFIRELLYDDFGPRLYEKWLVVLIVWPALGGLLVGVISRVLFRATEGHGVPDVIESVVRSSGFVQPRVAVEKILTSAITIGSGGAVGAEGPIVQIGAAIASGVGWLFRIARPHMPVLVACGCAGGISAVFNAPIGGLLFTLEVILQDFSIRTLTPIVIASVVANVSTQAIFGYLNQWLGHESRYQAIFAIPQSVRSGELAVSWPQLANFAILGVLCGVIAVALIRLMFWTEERFTRTRLPAWLRPAVGGAWLGTMGVIYVLVYQRFFSDIKPVPFDVYAMPAFFGDGYGVIQQLLRPSTYDTHAPGYLLVLMMVWCGMKIIGTSITLGSGGAGGIIAPSLFLGATGGSMLGILLRDSPLLSTVRPELYALIGMAGVLAAVVHAPLASVLILVELTGDNRLVLPAMLTVVIASGTGRLMFPDSVYTFILRKRGVRLTPGEAHTLRRTSVEQLGMDPATTLQPQDPLERAIAFASEAGTTDFVVLDNRGEYVGMLVEADLHHAVLDREAVPLLLVGDVMRRSLPTVRNTDDLATVLDAFAQHQVDYLPVVMASSPKKVVGLVSRDKLMRQYRQG